MWQVRRTKQRTSVRETENDKNNYFMSDNIYYVKFTQHIRCFSYLQKIFEQYLHKKDAA